MKRYTAHAWAHVLPLAMLLAGCQSGSDSVVASYQQANRKVSVTALGVDKTGCTDDTALLQSIINDNPGGILDFDSGTYVFDYLTISQPITLRTSGFTTIFKRTTTPIYNHPVITVSADNVTIDGNISFSGNIANDTGEFNHCISLEKSSAGSIRNFTCGVINVADVRGDALYIGGTPTCEVHNVDVVGVVFSNVLRSGVSVAGGENIHVGFIAGFQNGYRTFNVEPNPTGNQSCSGIRVDYINGTRVQLAGDAGNVIGVVGIGQCTLDGSKALNSSPAYAWYDATSPAVQGQNFGHAHMDYLAASGFSYVPCFFGSCPSKGRLSIDFYTGSLNGTAETTYKSQFVCDGLAELVIGSASILSYAPDRRIAVGLSSTRYQIGAIGKVESDGTGFAYGDSSVFDKLSLACGASDAFTAITNSRVSNSSITSTHRIAYGCTSMTFSGGAYSAAAFTAGGCSNIHMSDATYNATYYASMTP